MDFHYFLFACLFVYYAQKKRERKKEKSDQSNFCCLLVFTDKNENYLRENYSEEPPTYKERKFIENDFQNNQFYLFLINFNCIIIFHFKLFWSFIIINTFTIEKKSLKQKSKIILLEIFYSP